MDKERLQWSLSHANGRSPGGESGTSATQFKRTFKYVVYKITFPNGKIYVGKDVGEGGHSLRYFGTWNREVVEADFSREELIDFSLRKEILFESGDKQEVGREEMRLIAQLGSNNPDYGYNRTPKYRVAK
tara:strand:+ start:152 stop:541 length:390 start_codon:yes stop_codon:yes gene_type:complete